MKPIILILLTTTALITPLALSCSASINTPGTIPIAVSISPQVEFIQSIGGENVDVTTMIPPGANPHTYEPLPSQIKNLSKVKMYAKVGSGIEFELAWMDKLIAANSDMHIVDCAQNVDLIQLRQDNTGRSGAFDPHIWLSPLNAKAMAQNMYAGMLKIDPANQKYYEGNLNSYSGKLDKLAKEINNLLLPVKERIFITYHPAFAYFARDFNLEMISIEEEGKEPSASDIASIIELAKKHNIKVIIVSPQFNPQSAEVIAAELQGKVLPVDHLAQNYIDNLRNFASELAKANR